METHLCLGHNVGSQLDHGKVALADGLLQLIVADPEELVHGYLAGRWHLVVLRR